MKMHVCIKVDITSRKFLDPLILAILALKNPRCFIFYIWVGKSPVVLCVLLRIVFAVPNIMPKSRQTPSNQQQKFLLFADFHHLWVSFPGLPSRSCNPSGPCWRSRWWISRGTRLNYFTHLHSWWSSDTASVSSKSSDKVVWCQFIYGVDGHYVEIGIAPFAELLRKKVPKGQVAKAATELKFHDLWHFCCFAYFSR